MTSPSLRILTVCVTNRPGVMAVADVLGGMPDSCRCDFLVPHEGPVAQELRERARSVILGGWEGIYARGAVRPEVSRQLVEARYSHVLLLASNSSGAGYEALSEFCSKLGAGSVSFVFPDLSVRAIAAGNGKAPIGGLHGLFCAAGRTLQAATPDTLFYTDRNYPESWAAAPAWEEFGGIFETTFRCNFHCVHCPRKVAGLDEKASIDPAAFAAFVSNPRIGHVTLLGLGETLMNPRFDSIAATLAKKRVPVALVTNGSLLDAARLGPLPDGDLSVVISIDGADDDLFGRLRAPGWLARVRENVRRLRGESPRTKICINTVVSDGNYPQLAKLVELAAGIGAQRVNVLNVLALEPESDRHHGLHAPENERSEYLMAASRRAAELGVCFAGKPLSPSMRACRSPWNQMYVAMNGDVYPCSFIYRIPKDEFLEYFHGESVTVPLAAFRLGNLHRDSVESIWEGPTARRIREVLLESQRDRQLRLDEFRRLRRETVLKEPLDYCRICLNRWDCAC